MPRKKSQTDKTLDRLIKSGWIDEVVAQRLGINRLPGQIYRLKERGHVIWSYNDGKRVRYALREL